MEPENYHLALKTAFASEYAFYVKAQNFHWNVVGRLFAQDHELFGRIYEEVGGILDAFAENLRKAGCLAPAGFGELARLSAVQDAGDLSSEGMYEELLADSDRLASLFGVMFEMTEDCGDYGLSNFFADRQDAHRKHSWMLRSSLAAAGVDSDG